MNIIIFGAGGIGQRVYRGIIQNTSANDKVLCFCDNDRLKQNSPFNGLGVLAVEDAAAMNFDKIIIASAYAEEMKEQLLSLNIREEKIEIFAEPITSQRARVQWLRDYAKLIGDRDGDVAEAGVFKGEFAKHINECFPEKRLYLFDTFEGFQEIDLQREKMPIIGRASHFSDTSAELVLGKMPYPEKAIIRKGFFPESAKDIRGRFCFVNLDMDLYQPTFEGLKFFWDKMIPGGVILIHDFYGEDYPNVKTAVYDFEKLLPTPLKIIPIGDALSIAVIR
jgi:hypothetical protein